MVFVLEIQSIQRTSGALTEHSVLCAASQTPANVSDFLWPHFTSAAEGLANLKIPYDFCQRHNFISRAHSRSDDGPEELKRAETTFMFATHFEFQTLAFRLDLKTFQI